MSKHSELRALVEKIVEAVNAPSGRYEDGVEILAAAIGAPTCPKHPHVTLRCMACTREKRTTEFDSSHYAKIGRKGGRAQVAKGFAIAGQPGENEPPAPPAKKRRRKS